MHLNIGGFGDNLILTWIFRVVSGLLAVRLLYLQYRTLICRATRIYESIASALTLIAVVVVFYLSFADWIQLSYTSLVSHFYNWVERLILARNKVTSYMIDSEVNFWVLLGFVCLFWLVDHIRLSRSRSLSREGE